jgi:glycerol-3-phosphate dehydrogenase (NAD(P)+)
MLDKRVVIIGKGVWGQALASVLSVNVAEVNFWDREGVIVDADVVVLALPVQAIREALELARPSCRIMVNTSKGIEQGTNYLPQQIVREVLGERIDYYALMGASFANELVLKTPTMINLGYRKGLEKELVKRMFQTDYLRVRLFPHLEKLETASAFKNVYAIICGLADGMGYGVNTRVALISLALEEMQRFFHAGNAAYSGEALVGISGDLVLTCNSMESRNFRFGRFLVEYSVQEALERVGSTVEGYATVQSVKEIVAKKGVSLPLAELVEKIIREDNPKIVRGRIEEFLKSV